MSRSNNTEIIHPSKRYYEWSGSKGCLKYFDKSRGEKGEDVFVNLPFTFLVLDKLHTIRGYSDSAQSGFWSNEIRDIKTERLTVKNKKGTIATDVYANLAPVLNQGAQYCQSVYIAVKDEKGQFIICNLQLQGSSIGPWIELNKGKDIYKFAVTISGATAAKKGQTNYFIPIFSLNPNISPETEAKALDLDKELQEYLKNYFNRNSSQQRENVVPAEAVSTNHVSEDEINTVLADDVRSITVPLDDLPF